MTADQRRRIDSLIWIDPERMSGAPCFHGTRVPVQNLMDYIIGGSTIHEFLDDFPSVAREHVFQFLELAMQESAIVVVDRDILNGIPCFRGTRVPLRNLIDYVEGGHTLGEFLRQFPTVSRELAMQALQEITPFGIDT